MNKTTRYPSSGEISKIVHEVLGSMESKTKNTVVAIVIIAVSIMITAVALRIMFKIINNELI